jgi:uncharacterized damage-inducible protein DinB
MDTKTIRLLAAYNEKANREMNGFISQLDEAQWNRHFDAFFPSIRTVVNHIYIADFNWLKRFGKLRDFKYITDGIFAHEISFAANAFETREDYLSLREYMDKLIITFADEVTDADLEQSFKYVDSRGTEYTRNFGGSILHMFNHQTHHRGMVSVFLEMMGIENDYSNLVHLV